jgi:Lon protease-like protein
VAAEGPVELPLFDLPIVLLPGELVPLHIFEERYKAMIAHCLDRDEPFGIVLSDDEEGTRDVGCTAEIAEILERFEDGRLNLVVSGGAPFRVLDRHEAELFPAGTVEPIDLASEPEDGDPEARERALGAFAELAREAAEDPDAVVELPDGDSYAIAGRITLPPETKQMLLETRSEGERMRTLANALEAVQKALSRSRKVAETAKSNGHARL